MRVTSGGDRATPSVSAQRPTARPSAAFQAGLLILAFLLGFVVCQGDWHRPLTAWVASFVQRPAFTVTALLHRSELPSLGIDLSFRNYQSLLEVRSHAVAQGSHSVQDLDYVPATVRLVGDASSVLMRFPAGSVERLAGDRWPFEVLVEDGDLFGMRHLRLTPADEFVLMTWGYLETLRQSGLLSVRYEPVRVVLNGTPKGLYVVEEVPTIDSLEMWGRATDVIVSYDQSAYWEARTRLRDALPGGGFQYARITTLCPSTPAGTDEELTGADHQSMAICDRASADLQALQTGDRAPSELLDAEKVGEFLALTTLWRGTAQLDWRAVHWVYDPVAARFELIGTASMFTPIAPLPSTYTDDPLIQVAYVRALERFSNPDFLAELRTSLQADLEAMQLALGTDLGYFELPWAVLESNQDVMRRQITPSQPLFASIGADQATLTLNLVNTQPFPIEILDLDIGESFLLPVSRSWVDPASQDGLVNAGVADASDSVVLHAARAEGPYVVLLRVPSESLPTDIGWAQQTPGAIQVITRVVGRPAQRIAVTVYPDDPTVFPSSGETLP
ncbi:MAG: hypothetical protein GX620_07085 [Chloroflexi bacterium]|nr:hypothetical protein [Chloroflexota bacterium]